MQPVDIEIVSAIVRAASSLMDRSGRFEIHDKGTLENFQL